MKAEYLKLYSKTEQAKLHALEALFTKWEKMVGDREGYWFVPDGFYPRYFAQKTKILYIGRDAYNVYESYITQFMQQYLTGRMGDNGVNINRVKFHKMLIKVAYGLIHDCPWRATKAHPEQIPSAFEICQDGKVFERATFAFMNLCKWTHEHVKEGGKDEKEKGTGWGVDREAVDEFVNKSVTQKRNFFLEEIELLDPDIIITLHHMPNLIARWTGNLAKRVATNGNCCVYRLSNGKHERMIFDPWHFSSWKSEERDIYNPLWKMTRKWCPR